MSDPSVPPVPDALLVPLLDEAAAVLRDLEDDAVPASLRPLRGFHARGLHAGTARAQLRRAVEEDEGFRRAVVERFLDRPEAEAALEGWSPAGAPARLTDSAARDDLPWVASVLYAARPPGWAFGLGVACGVFTALRREAEHAAVARAAQARAERAEEARREADVRHAHMEGERDRLARDLRAERAGRAAREHAARQEAEQARREADAARRELEAAQRAAAAERARAERARAKAAELEAALARRRARERDAALVLSDDDLRTLSEAAGLARRLAEGLAGVADQIARRRGREPALPRAGAGPSGPAPTSETRRRPAFDLPPGVRFDTPQGVEAALRTPGAVLVVDGYNLSMRAWSGASVADQRERLLAALGALHARTRARVVAVFDGADVTGVARAHRPGVHVRFSEPGQEADSLVVEAAREAAGDGPVLVASSDRWVQDHAEAVGARVVGSDVLAQALRA